MIQVEDVLKPTLYISSPAKAGSQGIAHTHTHTHTQLRPKKKKVEEKKTHSKSLPIKKFLS